MKHLVLAVALTAACAKKKDDAPKPEPVPTGSGSAVSAPGDAAAARAADGACEEPCRLLADASLDAVRTRCPDWSLGAKGTAGCDEIDLARNCVFATYGYPFKRADYRRAFSEEPWYEPNPAFDDAMMSKQAVDNVLELKGMAIACKAHGEDQISPKTREVVEAWFATREHGVPPLPDKMLDLDARPITKDAFVKQYLGKDSELFFKDRWEPIRWVERRGKAEVVAVGTGVPNPATCKDEGEICAGYETIFFVVEDGKITGIEMFAAG